MVGRRSGTSGPSTPGTAPAAGGSERMSRPRTEPQSLLWDLLIGVAAPTVAVSGPDGQIRRTGAQGILHADVRVLSEAVLRVDGAEPETVSAALTGASGARVTAIVRTLGDPGPDPTVRVDRLREVSPGSVVERLVVSSTATIALATAVELAVGADFADIAQVKSGLGADPVPATVAGETVLWAIGEVSWTLAAPGAQLERTESGALVRWHVRLEPRESVTLSWQLSATDRGAVVAAAPSGARELAVRCEDRRVPQLVTRSLIDLAGLRMATATDPDQVFLAAGAPWYLTLFGRDSLWAARMLLPVDPGLAAGTLSALAARQGTTVDPLTGEEPGKIPHEIRRVPEQRSRRDGSRALPPISYGTVDATSLWLCLLHDAWRWGMAESALRLLLPQMRAALAWQRDAIDGDGFLGYLDLSGTGLSNQGWKDSADSVRHADGTRAVGPIRLCEVQAYAHEAALGAAAVLDALGEPGAEEQRAWAEALAERFRQRFWVADESGPFPAMALDGAGHPVATVTSNIGHLPGTGLLTVAEERIVARFLTGPELDSGFGLRTMSARAAAYAPLSYHCGSVWPHDTAIAVTALARSGLAGRCEGLLAGLLAAGAAFDYRLPELWGGYAHAGPGDPGSADSSPVPVPYAAACRPQAWSAAAPLAVLTAAIGLRADVPNGTLTVATSATTALSGLEVAGLRAGAGTFWVSVDERGRVDLDAGTTGLTVARLDPADGAAAGWSP